MPLTKLAFCPACGYTFDSATETTGKSRPSAGDISICLRCANVMAFTEDLGVRALTATERDEVYRDERVRHARAAVILNNLTNP